MSTSHPGHDALASLEDRWAYRRALLGDSTAASCLLDLDTDCMSAVAEALPVGWPNMNAASLDCRVPSLVHLASTCKLVAQVLAHKVQCMHAAHLERLAMLEAFCTRALSTSFWTLQRASLSAACAGFARCACCEEMFARAGGLYFRAPENGCADLPANIECTDAWLCCARCWREQLELSMRPSPFEGIEQTWEDPIEEGTFRLVEDFSKVDALDSPLLVREEHSAELIADLPDTAFVEGVTAARRVMMQAGFSFAPAITPRGCHLLADLVGSGYAEHIISLDLLNSGLDDAGLRLLSSALVGNAPFLQFLGLNGNPISGAGICDFAELLTQRRYHLMLPLLRWLHAAVDMGDAGALSLAAALHRGALASLELIWCYADVDLHDPSLGAVELAIVCARRGVDLEIGMGNEAVAGFDMFDDLQPEVREAAYQAWEDAEFGLDSMD